ncbi:hypothetical protein [Pseudidiomarina taiwanensis]|uniref:Chalcone isomerase domain-containing protein n=1 Tax=Pseudidiomarina taiwanensis TaxID=337250 RepID=A0A432ZN17_9GAMM|nr:hypothetical protein [Pseudidiomarina taiwanensis]RUO79256.1 hypothetical protein CWI83_01715 [Pseudidiomarina taiwanensis]
MNRSLVQILSLVALVASVSPQAHANQCATESYQELTPVGATRLSVLFWDIYDAELRTDTGRYGNASQRALKLDYLREISSADLVESTDEEWQRLGFRSERHQQWLTELAGMWPDVQKGDCLVLIEDAQGHANFYNAEGLLGSIDAVEFTNDFLAIWLSEKSRFKDERNALIGEEPR